MTEEKLEGPQTEDHQIEKNPKRFWLGGGLIIAAIAIVGFGSQAVLTFRFLEQDKLDTRLNEKLEEINSLQREIDLRKPKAKEARKELHDIKSDTMEIRKKGEDLARKRDELSAEVQVLEKEHDWLTKENERLSSLTGRRNELSDEVNKLREELGEKGAELERLDEKKAALAKLISENATIELRIADLGQKDGNLQQRIEAAEAILQKRTKSLANLWLANYNFRHENRRLGRPAPAADLR